MTCILRRSDGTACLLDLGHDGLCVFDSATPPAKSFTPRKSSKMEMAAVAPPPLRPFPIPRDATSDEDMAADELAAITQLARDVEAGKCRSYVNAAQALAAFILAHFDAVG